MVADRAARRLGKTSGAASRATGTSPTWIAGVLVFAFLIAMLGGSSRYDQLQVAILLPVACLAAGCGLIWSWDADWRPLKVPLILLGAWAGLTLLQIIPLPPDIWRALPGREPLAQVADVIGDDLWRPLSMVPWRTQHALWALSVPFAALVLFAALRERALEIVLPTMITIAVVSALLGMLQVTAPNADPLYFYAITNRSSPVGLFANANHAAIFSAAMLVVVAATMKLLPRHMASWRLPVLGGAFFILLVSQFINSSRAGLSLTAVALLFSALIAAQAVGTQRGRRSRRAGVKGMLASKRLRIALPLFVGSLLLVALFYLADRLPGLDQINETSLEDLRFQLAPVLQDMVWAYFPVGSGFGTFETVYQMHEPSSMLSSAYVNQAHNDILQVALEGGLVGVAIVLAALWWLAQSIRRLYRQGGSNRLVLVFAATAILACLVLGSAVDYPLRAPLFQVIAVWLVCSFALLARDRPSQAAGAADS